MVDKLLKHLKYLIIAKEIQLMAYQNKMMGVNFTSSSVCSVM